jgi:hypothetical protein
MSRLQKIEPGDGDEGPQVTTVHVGGDEPEEAGVVDAADEAIAGDGIKAPGRPTTRRGGTACRAG